MFMTKEKVTEKMAREAAKAKQKSKGKGKKKKGR